MTPAGMPATTATGDRPPLLRVISGEATDEEIAAILAVVATRATPAAVAGPPAAGPPTTSTWNDRAPRMRCVRGVFTPGRDGWRTAFWPR